MAFWSIGTDVINYLLSHPTILFAGLLMYIFVFTLSVFFAPPRKGRNPFKVDRVKKRESLVIDQKARDGILKQGFLPKKIPERVDAIVIGSGIGGLTTATLLARTGKRVLVLEQHDRAGGCCHTFIEKGYEFDVGIHYIGNISNNSTFQVLTEQLTSGQVKWASLDEDYDVVCLNVHDKPKLFEHRLGRDKWRARLVEMFPKEEAGIDKYIAKLKEASRAASGQVMLKSMSRWMSRLFVLTGFNSDINAYLRLAKKSTKEVLKECTTNKDLQAVLCSNLGDYGSTPRHSSFLMQAALNNHYMWSASYPVGGASELVIHMIPAIEANGGRVLVRAPVSQILVDANGKANGVRVHRSSGDVDIHAPLIISNTGLFNTVALMPPEIREKSSLNRMVTEKKVKSSLACLQVFVGLKGSPEELKLKAQNVWAYSSNDYDGIFEEYLNLTAEEALEAPPPLAFISMMAAKDPTFQDRFPGKSTITVVGLCRWDWFKSWKDDRINKRGEEYEDIKNKLGKKLWETTLSLYPHLADKVDYFEVGSPLSNDYYLGTKKGELYGLDHNIQRSSDPDVLINLRAETDVKGLYMTGQDILTCGYAGGVYSGLMTASSILHRNLFTDLLALRKAISMRTISPSELLNQEAKKKDKHV